MSTTTTTTTETSASTGTESLFNATLPNFEGLDPEQVRLMGEQCIVLDQDDKPIGTGSKSTCHLMENINKGLLHRAFSVFLFRPSDGKLLLQKRASEKITFPDMWTNTCCSHPLALQDEMEEAQQIGARRAAQRKLEHELGIKAEQVPLEDFLYVTRIHYLAPSSGIWGEHEIDYVFFISADVDVHANPNEVSDTQYVSKAELEALFTDSSLTFTPWFKLIAKSFLYQWWDKLLERSKALDLLEGTHPAAPPTDGNANSDAASNKPHKKVDVEVLREMITQKDKDVIKRF